MDNKYSNNNKLKFNLLNNLYIFQNYPESSLFKKFIIDIFIIDWDSGLFKVIDDSHKYFQTITTINNLINFDIINYTKYGQYNLSNFYYINQDEFKNGTKNQNKVRTYTRKYLKNTNQYKYINLYDNKITSFINYYLPLNFNKVCEIYLSYIQMEIYPDENLSLYYQNLIDANDKNEIQKLEMKLEKLKNEIRKKTKSKGLK